MSTLPRSHPGRRGARGEDARKEGAQAEGTRTADRHTRWKAGRVPALAAAGLALAAAGGLAARSLWPAGVRPAPTADVPVASAAVIRTDIAARQVVAGVLGYAGAFSVPDELAQGIVTWLPSPGDVVRRGHPLYQVAGQRVTLLYGPVPAWRAFAPGMTAGPDVRELQRNLAALGFAPGPADGQFGWSTEAAIARWQRALGQSVTGTVPLGAVAFLPGPLRVTATAVSPGAQADTGATLLSGTSDIPAVSVWVTAGGAPVRAGDPVLVTMPDGTTTVRGTVTTVGRVAVAGGGQNGAGPGGGVAAGQGSGGPGQGSGAAASGPAAIPVTIGIGRIPVPAWLDQSPVQVAITQQRDRNVLAVPVTALLALPGGGYAVRASGQGRQLIPVTTGLYDDAAGLVEVTGRGLLPGLAVEVAQP